MTREQPHKYPIGGHYEHIKKNAALSVDKYHCVLPSPAGRKKHRRFYADFTCSAACGLLSVSSLLQSAA